MIDTTIQNYNLLFWKFVHGYDIYDTNIMRKVIHSFSVAEKCFAIASVLNLTKKQREFAYLVGLFHDAGRFEQWKLYQTYNDKLSVDHGDLGAELLKTFEKDVFGLTQREIEVMIEAIKYHTKPYQGDDNDVVLFNQIVMNADAYANVITTANGAQQMTVESDGVTPEILNDFCDMKPLWIYSPKTKLDRALMLMACAYYVKYNFLRKEILEKRYIDIMFETFSQYLDDNDKKIYKYAVEVLKKEYLQ